MRAAAVAARFDKGRGATKVYHWTGLAATSGHDDRWEMRRLLIWPPLCH